MFGTILITICTLMHVYVFWRASSVPLILQHLPLKILVGIGIILWAVFYLGRVVGHGESGVLARGIEFLGMTWMAFLFLSFILLFAIDLVTLFGLFASRLSASLRGFALLAGAVLSAIALIQGLRPPVITEYEVNLTNLPKEMDRTVVVAIGDTHLGSQIGADWLAGRIDQIKAQQPDLVVFLGDIFEGHGASGDKLMTEFKKLSSSMDVWAVTGNHEFHGGGRAIQMMEESGFKLLRNRWVEVRPGLIFAGVDDLTTRQRRGQKDDFILQALAKRPPGATVLLSHTPWEVKRAAKMGVGLMLSAHTHGGQIWPFDYLVRSSYPYLEGLYRMNGMTLIVSRGTGTWGPRMRLWLPGEILRLTLRSKNK